jgi:hypothetical protein
VDEEVPDRAFKAAANVGLMNMMAAFQNSVSDSLPLPTTML